MAKVLIRTDASFEIGGGHVTRCLTLANRLRDFDLTSVFACVEHSGNMISQIEQNGFEVIRLPNDQRVEIEPGLKHATWLGGSWRFDAEQTIQSISGSYWDWLVVDHYALDKSWEQLLRPYVGRIFVVDDLADRQHDCDLLLDQNFVVGFEERYAALLPASCIKLLGPKYALLQADYSTLRARTPYRMGRPSRLMVYFGAGDQHNLTEKAISAFLASEHKHVTLDVVVNSSHPQVQNIRSQTRDDKRITLHENLPSLAPLMMKCDLAIGASGSTSWERCCLRLPSIVVTVAENQRPIAEALHNAGISHWVGHHDEVSTTDLKSAIDAIVAQQELKDWSKCCGRLLDGKGALRVTDVMMLSSDLLLSARPTVPEDEECWLNCIANVGEQVVASFQPSILELNDKKSFFRLLRSNDKFHTFIVETPSGLEVGAVIFESNGSGWSLSVLLSPAFEGRIRPEKMIEATISVILDSKLLQNLTCSYPAVQSNDDMPSIIICTDAASWLNQYVVGFLSELLLAGHSCTLVHDLRSLEGGDLCFLLSFQKIVPADVRQRYRHTLVVHESSLPDGKGWSPLTWQVIQGRTKIPVSIIEASDEVDSGQIYFREEISLEGHELVTELRELQAETTFSLCRKFITQYRYGKVEGCPQTGRESFFEKRSPEDSRLDSNLTIAEQFNLLRVVDNKNYPAFFEHLGRRYILKIEEMDKDG